MPHYEVSGPDGSACVVLLHGWGSSAELMRPIARMLDDRFRVLNIDLPGHGRTPPPPTPIGVEECAQLVSDVIRTESPNGVTIVGHSNGGRIALFMASDDRFARLINRLVLISPSGIRPQRGLKVRLKSLVASFLKAPFMVLPTNVRMKGLDWLRDSIVWRMLGSSDYRALSGVMRETFVRTVNFFVDDRLSRINVPTLIFWGERDTAVGSRQIEKLAAAIPDSGVVPLKGAGHYGYLDDPATVKAGTRHFIEQGSAS
ncbi:MAG TPA: alpha/beta hydrolase [Rhodothermales bacterium]